jgi:hypothetical protein
MAYREDSPENRTFALLPVQQTKAREILRRDLDSTPSQLVECLRLIT